MAGESAKMGEEEWSSVDSDDQKEVVVNEATNTEFRSQVPRAMFANSSQFRGDVRSQGKLTDNFCNLPNDFRKMKTAKNILGRINKVEDAQDMQIFLNVAAGPAGFAAWTMPAITAWPITRAIISTTQAPETR